MSDSDLTEEHHSWIESFCGASSRPAEAAASSPAPAAAAAAPAPAKEEGGFFSSISHAVSAVGDAASSLVHGAVDVAEGAVSAVTSVADKAIHVVADTVATVETAVVDAVPLPDSIKSVAHDVIDFQKGVVEGAADGTKGLVDGVAHLAGSVTKEGYDLATSEKAREEAAATVVHGAEAVGGFVQEAVTDPSKAWDDTKSAVSGAADKVVQIGRAVYHSYEEAEKAGHGAEWLGKGVGQVGVMVAGAVLTDGASLAGEGAAVGAEAVTVGAELLEGGAALGKGAEVLEEGATLVKGAEVVEDGAAVAKGAEAVEEGGAAVKGAKAADQGALEAEEEQASLKTASEAEKGGESELGEQRADPATPKDKIQRSPSDERMTRPKGNIAPHNEQGLALRDAKGARGSESEHVYNRANMVEQTRNPATGVSPFDQEAYENATTLKIDRATAVEKTRGDNATWRALKKAGGAPTDAELEASGLEAAMNRTLDAAKLTGDSSVTEEAVNLAGHGEMGSLFEVGTQDARGVMQGVSDAEIDGLLGDMENTAKVDGRFAAPKGMGLPLRGGQAATAATEEAAAGGAAEAGGAAPRVRVSEAPPQMRVDPKVVEEVKALEKARAEQQAAEEAKAIEEQAEREMQSEVKPGARMRVR